jgi:hypothetical protein
VHGPRSCLPSARRPAHRLQRAGTSPEREKRDLTIQRRAAFARGPPVRGREGVRACAQRPGGAVGTDAGAAEQSKPGATAHAPTTGLHPTAAVARWLARPERTAPVARLRR